MTIGHVTASKPTGGTWPILTEDGVTLRAYSRVDGLRLWTAVLVADQGKRGYPAWTIVDADNAQAPTELTPASMCKYGHARYDYHREHACDVCHAHNMALTEDKTRTLGNRWRQRATQADATPAQTNDGHPSDTRNVA